MKNIAALAGATSAASTALLTTTETQSRWSLGSFVNSILLGSVAALDVVICKAGITTWDPGTMIANLSVNNAPIFQFSREVGTTKSRKLIADLPANTAATVVLTRNAVDVTDSLVAEDVLLQDLLLPIQPALSLSGLISKVEAFIDGNPDEDMYFVIDQESEVFAVWATVAASDCASEISSGNPIHAFEFIADAVAPDTTQGWE